MTISLGRVNPVSLPKALAGLNLPCDRSRRRVRDFLRLPVPGMVAHLLRRQASHTSWSASGRLWGSLWNRKSGGILRSTVFWQGWSVAATVAAVFAFAANVEYSADGHAPDYVAIFGDAGTEPMWVVNADLEDGVINVRAGSASAPAGRRGLPPLGGAPGRPARDRRAAGEPWSGDLSHRQGRSSDSRPRADPRCQPWAGSRIEDDESTPTSFDYRATITRL